MDLTENQSLPFHQRQTSGNTKSKIHQEINYNSELDLTHEIPLNSIFVTDSSRNLSLNEQNNSSDRRTTSINIG